MNEVMNNYEVTHDFPFIGHRTMLLNARQVDSKQLILLAMEDVTARKQLKIDSDEMNTNLTRQRDLLQGLSETKDEFVSLASHQLRTPATAVKQYVGMVVDGFAGDLNKDQIGLLGIAYKNNERQLEIIEDLLRVAKVDDGKVYLEKAYCDVVSQVKSVIEDQAISYKSRNQTVVLNISRDEVYALIDPKLMIMVVENLLDNAGKYSPDGAEVVIDIDQDIDHTTISVTDCGVGILQKDRHKLFKKFSRIDNPLSGSVKGTGLGLYWAKKILDLHEGSIEVTSKIRKGSTFTVKMPFEVERPSNIAVI
jgi:signal transduction histidine kinase